MNKVEANQKRFLHLKEEFWKQKIRMKWFLDGEKCKVFSCMYVGKKKKYAGNSNTIMIERYHYYYSEYWRRGGEYV